MDGKSNWGTNKKQFVLERVTVGLCIVPALVWAMAPVFSLSLWYIRISCIAFGILAILYFYMGIYRVYIKKDWYKGRKTVFPATGTLIVVFLWALLPFFPPDISIKDKWVPFLLMVFMNISSIVDYRVNFGILNEDNPKTDDNVPEE